jgi:hypothetical protein
MSVRSRLATFRELIFWPALAAVLPWRLGFRLLDGIASRGELYCAPTAEAIAGAASVTPIDDERDWKRRYRLTRLVDHCDMFLMRLRGRRWFEKNVEVEGEWPASGPFVAMTFHWGAGLWALRQMHQSGATVRLVAAPMTQDQVRADPVGGLYARWRFRAVELAGGGPVIFTGGACVFAIRRALADGHAVVALYDIPAGMTSKTLRTTVCGRPVSLPAGMATLAVKAGVPVVAFEMAVDYLTGRRRLRIEPAFTPASPQEFADRLADSMTRLLGLDTAAWHFSGLAPHFFRAAGPASSPPLPIANQAGA